MNPSQTEDLLYVGGPLHGQSMSKAKFKKDHPNSEWPPRFKGCISDIKVGQKIGMYHLRGATLEWRLSNPVKVKT